MGQAGVPLERSLTMTAEAGRGRYARSMEYFDDRRRAESFGEGASDYDAYRQRYPAAPIAAIMQSFDAVPPRSAALSPCLHAALTAAILHSAAAASDTPPQTSSNAATDSGTGTDAVPGTVTGTDPDARVPRILDVGSGTGILASHL